MNESYLTFTEYCTQLYRSKMDEAFLMNQFHEQTSTQLTQLNEQYAYAIWYILNIHPSSSFDKNSYTFTLNQVKNKPSTKDLRYFHTAFKTYRQLTETIQEFADAGFNPQTKNKLYRIPTYVSLLDDCLTPLLKLLVSDSGKELSHLYEILKPNHLDVFDLSILEAIHTGNFISFSEGKLLGFNTTQENSMLLKTFSCQEFDELIHEIYDLCSGILLGLAYIFSEIDAQIASDAREKDIHLSFEALALKLSLPSLECLALNDVNQDQAQLNITMKVEQSDPNFLICTAIEIVTQIFEIYPGYHRYLVNFEHNRLASAFVLVQAEDIVQILADYSQLSVYIEKMLMRGDIKISAPSEEIIDLKEIARHQYPTLITDTLEIKGIESASSENFKRLTANLFISETTEKSEIQAKIEEAVDWLKTIRTAPLSKFETKHGEMETDSIYLSVFKKDRRQNKQLTSTNENFICFVEYNQDGRSTLKNGGLSDATWNQLHKEQIGFLTIGWRDQKNNRLKAVKIGRNDACPCGSGKKYKKCHGK